MAESDNLLTRLQDLLVYLIPQLNKFPRDQKFVLGDRHGSRRAGSGNGRCVRWLLCGKGESIG